MRPSTINHTTKETIDQIVHKRRIHIQFYGKFRTILCVKTPEDNIPDEVAVGQEVHVTGRG
jgi:hypothetical protein